MAATTHTYRLLKGNHTRIEGINERTGKPHRARYTPNKGSNLIELTPAEAKNLGARVRPFVPGEESPHDDTTVVQMQVGEAGPASKATKTPFGVSSLKAPEARALIASLDSMEDLNDLYFEERDGKARPTVIGAIEERVTELEGGEGDEETAGEETDEDGA